MAANFSCVDKPKSTKLAFVELVNGSLTSSFGILLENDDNESGKTDLEKIAAALQQKSKFLKVTISENASIKDHSHIRCVIVTPDSDKFNWNGCKTIFPDSQESGASSVRNSTAIFEDIMKAKHSMMMKVKTLTNTEYLAIYRILADSIEERTIHPHPDSIRYVVDRVLTKFPHLILDKNDSLATNRSKNDEKFSRKGGRVSTKKLHTDDHGPLSVKKLLLEKGPQRGNDCPAVDMVSYAENVAKLIEVCRNFGNQATSIEFELIKGTGICQKFMANWIEYVPLIIKLASKVKNSQDAISKVFDMYNAADINKTFDVNACIALELLPHLLPVRNKKGTVATNYLYYVQEETASLEATLRSTTNRPSFILHLGNTFHVIVDNEVFLSSSNNVSEALLNMFCCYYVF
ncbi:hypothetical protein OUZ56_012323 [Daphnia magna]|uniref:Uncharacterized protein n=1 Tax=Daphnia magna TaxID=35525 RepID=A0ABQ9Z2N1_9CRUS|nr:hypothetical protein OUZ56_012323 [Daphnia magna]